MKKVLYGIAALFVVFMWAPAQAVGAAGSGYNWTGFYGGLNAGVAINNSQADLRPSGAFAGDINNPLRTDSADFSDPAFTIGGQVGYNYQMGCFLIGLETDFNYNTTDETNNVDRALAAPLVGRFLHSVSQTFDFFGTVRGRIGYTPMDRWLVYGTGGLAYGNVSSDSDVLFTAAGDYYIGSKSKMRVGWTAGAGSEYAISGPWSVKFEYLYIDLGTQSYTYATPLFPAYSYTTDLDTSQHVVRFGINYKFF